MRRAGSGLDVKLDFSSVPDYSQDPEKDVIVGIVPSGCWEKSWLSNSVCVTGKIPVDGQERT